MTAPAVAENTGFVVLGSWRELPLAEAGKTRVRDRLGVQADILPVQIDGERRFRLVSPAMVEADARAMIADLAGRGVSAWFLRGDLVASATPRGMPVSPVASREEPMPAPDPARQATSSTAVSPPDPETTSVSTTDRLANAVPPAPASRAKPADPDTGAAVHVPYFETVSIAIDGLADEAAWSEVPGYDDMRVTDPDTLEEPRYRTFYRFLYTREGLYVAAFMEQPPDTLVSRLSSRDRYLNRDSFGLTLDTSGEGLYGYWFTVTLGGSVMDGKVAPERTITEQWDGPWLGASARLADGWSAEMFLPWSMMAMPASNGADGAPGPRKLTFWVDRRVSHLDERHSWPALPYSGQRFMSAFRDMRLERLDTRRQLAFFPYASTTHDGVASEVDYRGGVDVAWRPTPNLQLTGTVNPDFGAVESDDIVVNLTAFETFFPEKRLFFLEGNEVFFTTPRSDFNRYRSHRYGVGARERPPTYRVEPTTLVNTRRIGGPPRHLEVPDGVEVPGVERGKPTDLLAAVKAAGALGRLRFGALAAFEDEVELPGRLTDTGERVTVREDGRDFGVVRALYEAGGAGRRAIGYLGTVVALPDGEAMTHGIDAHLIAAGGRLNWDGQVMYSDGNGIAGDGTGGYGFFSDATYVPRQGIIHTLNFDYVDEHLELGDVGFIRQNDQATVQYGLILMNSNLGPFRQARNSVYLMTQSNTDGFVNWATVFTNQTFTFADYSELHLEVNYSPRRWDTRNSRGNGWFKIDSQWVALIGYSTNAAKKFSVSANVGAEQEELHRAWSPAADIGFTWVPNGRLSMDFDVRYKKRNGWLLHTGGRNFATFDADDLQPKLSIDYFITARQQLRLTLQWAGVEAEAADYYRTRLTHGELLDRTLEPDADSEDFSLSRLTAQLRYRWEIGPLSDLFVVYTRGNQFTYDDADHGFGTLWTDSLRDPVVDMLVVKLRYRFGS
ncbi:MAG: hypothetical protein F4X36_01045 [Gammaproteobacteria bacterium]|nr:hypothetical protein [Gammaproteobacteria bacterium]